MAAGQAVIVGQAVERQVDRPLPPCTLPLWPVSPPLAPHQYLRTPELAPPLLWCSEAGAWATHTAAAAGNTMQSVPHIGVGAKLDVECQRWYRRADVAGEVARKEAVAAALTLCWGWSWSHNRCSPPIWYLNLRHGTFYPHVKWGESPYLWFE